MMEMDANAGRDGATPLVSLEHEAPRSLAVEAAERVVSMTFASRSGNTWPHIVTVNPYGVITCSCQATVACHGIKDFCAVTGRATP